MSSIATRGKIFQISYRDFFGGVTPTIELSASHPFCSFWLDFRTKITTPLNCDPLVDAYASVLTSGPTAYLILNLAFFVNVS
jgi:hypothetical protein